MALLGSWRSILDPRRSTQPDSERRAPIDLAAIQAQFVAPKLELELRLALRLDSPGQPEPVLPGGHRSSDWLAARECRWLASRANWSTLIEL